MKTEQLRNAIILHSEHARGREPDALIDVIHYAMLQSHAELTRDRDEKVAKLDAMRAMYTERLEELDVLRTHLRDLDAKLPLLLRRLAEAESERDLAKQWGAELLVERDMLASSLEGRSDAVERLVVEVAKRGLVITPVEVLEDDGDPA